MAPFSGSLWMFRLSCCFMRVDEKEWKVFSAILVGDTVYKLRLGQINTIWHVKLTWRFTGLIESHHVCVSVWMGEYPPNAIVWNARLLPWQQENGNLPSNRQDVEMMERVGISPWRLWECHCGSGWHVFRMEYKQSGHYADEQGHINRSVRHE